MSKFLELQSAIEKTQLRYVVADFPIKHLEDGLFETKDGLKFRFTVDGAGYLSERNTAYKYAQFTRLFRAAEWVELEMLANKAMFDIKGAGKRLIFALDGEELLGLLRHYNFVNHQDLLDAIKAAHLETEVSGWNLTSQYLTMDVVVRTTAGDYDEDDLYIALRVLNGHSGHHALQYQLLVKARGYEYTAPLYGKSRHLSGVSTLVGQLKDAIDRVQEVKLDLRLGKLSALAAIAMVRECSPDMTVRQESLMHLLDASEVETGLDVFILLGQYANTRGYTTAVTNLLNPVIEKVLGL